MPTEGNTEPARAVDIPEVIDDEISKGISAENTMDPAVQEEEEAMGAESRDHMSPLPPPMGGHRRQRRCSELMEPLTDVADLERSLEYDAVSPGPIDRRRQLRRRTSELIEVGSLALPAQKRLNPTYRPTNFMFYRPPKQRQRWGQAQVLPRVNWGDLFFDLFYVAAGYNTSNILVESPDRIGCLYFLATFLSVMHPWATLTQYDARFVVMDDMYHRVFFLAFLCALASAVVHIRSVEILSQPSQHIDAFSFYLSLAMLGLIDFVRQIELYFNGKGDRDAIQYSALRSAKFTFMNMSLNVAAAVIAGKEYFGSEDGHRLLAGPTDDAEIKVNNVPIYLCLASFLCYWVPIYLKVVLCFPNDGSHKKTFTPLNIDFIIHRYSEWTMLMLGESILSLLIVDVPDENRDYFVTFYCSLVMIMMLQYLHFRSQPHHADDHASRKDKNLGTLWNTLNFIYSAALIALGAALTLFLLSFTYDEGEAHRQLEEASVIEARRLAGGGAAKYPHDEMEERTAVLFSISLFFVLFSLDGMSFCHVGWKESRERCRRNKEQGLKWMATLVLAMRCGVLIFAATLFLWETDSDILSCLGLAVVFSQLYLRKMGWKYLTPKEDDETNTDDEENKWPNVTHAQAEPGPGTPTKQASGQD